MTDLIGKALLDYENDLYTEDMVTETSISELDDLPVPYFFRTYKEMPLLEQKALAIAKGTVLDIGCGAGSHALYLQKKGHKVKAIDISQGAIEVCEKRGVLNTQCIDVLSVSEKKYDTLLLLMNGTGIFQKVDEVNKYLEQLKSILTPNGQILIDSSDIIYMYDEETNEQNETGRIVPAHCYYGEIEFKIGYKKVTTPWFPWLYLDEALFERLAHSNGFNFEVVHRGEHYDYLARLTT